MALAASPLRAAIPLVFLALLAGVLATGATEVLSIWPEDWILPFRTWVTDFFVWFSALAKPVTRAVSWVLLQPLTLVEALLVKLVNNSLPAKGRKPTPGQ